MKKKLFENGVIGNESLREYELFATLDGVRAIPTFVLTDREIKLPYNTLQNDSSINNEEKLLEKVNDLLLEVNGEGYQNLLSYDFTKDRGADRLGVILDQNQLDSKGK